MKYLRNIFIIIFIFNSYKSYSQDYNSNYLKGLSSLYYKNYRNSVNYLSLTLNENQNKIDKILLKRGEAYFELNMIDSALNDFMHVNKINKDLALYQIAQCFAKTNDIDNLIKYMQLYLKSNDKHYENYIKLDKNFASFHHTLQWKNLWKTEWYTKSEIQFSNAEYALKNSDFDEAFKILNSIIKKSNTNHKAYYLRAKAHFQKGNYESALENINKALSLKNSNSYLAQRAEIYLFLNKADKSIADYDLLIEQQPENLFFLFQRAKAENSSKQYNAAIDDLTYFLKYYPEEADAIFLLSEVYFNKGDYIESLSNINMLIKRKIFSEKIYLTRGKAYLHTKSFENAIKDFNKALDLNPQNAEIYYLRGLAKFELTDKKGACNDWNSAFQKGFKKANEIIYKYCKE